MKMFCKQEWSFSLELSQLFLKRPLDSADHITIEWYLEKGRDFGMDTVEFLNRRDDLGETLLHYYARSNNEPDAKEVCILLVTYGADINCMDNSEKTPLHKAVIAAKLNIVEMLLRQDAYVNAQDATKNTPLHYASTRDSQLCDLLLKCGADPNIKNNSHETPTFLAVRGVNNDSSDRKKIVKLLLGHGGNVLIRASNQQNSIEVASRLDNEDVFNWCRQNERNSLGKVLISVKFGFFSSNQVASHRNTVIYTRVMKLQKMQI